MVVMFNDEMILLSEEIVLDEYNQEEKIVTETKILCCKKSVTRSEFYLAKNADIKIDIVFIVNKFEFQNEKKLVYDGKTYEIVKTYELENELLELTCSECEVIE